MLLFLEFLCDLGKKLSYRQMLGADRLARAAADAIGRFSAALGMHVIVELTRPIAPDSGAVHTGEKPGYRYIRRASVGAIFAGGALDERCRAQDLAHLANSLKLRLRKRLEVLHK